MEQKSSANSKNLVSETMSNTNDLINKNKNYSEDLSEINVMKKIKSFILHKDDLDEEDDDDEEENDNDDDDDDEEDDDDDDDDDVYDDDDDEEEDDEDDENSTEQKINNKLLKCDNQLNTNTHLALDNDTKAKLEILLANAGIESITNDLFNNPDIMQALTTTYIKTFNEAELLTNNFHTNSASASGVSTSTSKLLDNNNIKIKKVKKVTKPTETLDNEKNMLLERKNINKQTFKEFIIASSASSSTSLSSSKSSISDNNQQQQLISDLSTLSTIKKESLLEQKLNEIKLINNKSSSSSSSVKTSPIHQKQQKIPLMIPQASSLPVAESMNNNQKKIVGKTLTELLEENADSVLGLACASGYIELVTVLLAINANIEDKGHKNESTPLMEACANGHKPIVDLLIKNGANVNAQSSCGNTPLHYAVQSNNLDIVEALIKNQAKIEEPNENGHTPLMEAASAGHLQCAKLLIEAGAGVNTHSNEFKETALTLACYKGNIDVVKLLLECGADQEHKTDEMHTALMEACMDGHTEVAKLLLDHGAQVNMPADSFESPLTLAACGGHSELANLLIEHGADLKERNDEGYTPLMEASREGHVEMVTLLLSHDPEEKFINAITEETQESALTLACCGGSFEVAKILIEAGADVNLGASTPLMEASQEGHIELVQLLLRSNALVNQCTTSGETSLSLACENGHTEVAELLINSGAHVDVPDPEKGYTPLMKAARAGHVCTVELLLKHGANINKATTYLDHTILSLACAGGHLPLVELLLANGADSCFILKDNSNCLIEAAKGGHTKIVQLLIDWPKSCQYYLPPSSLFIPSQSLFNEILNPEEYLNSNDDQSYSANIESFDQFESSNLLLMNTQQEQQINKIIDESLMIDKSNSLHLTEGSSQNFTNIPSSSSSKMATNQSQLVSKTKSTKLNKVSKLINKELIHNYQQTLNHAIPPVPPSSPQIASNEILQQQQLDCLTCKPDIALENLVNMLHKLAFGENSERQQDTQLAEQQQQSKKHHKTKYSTNTGKSKEEQIKRKETLLKELQKIEKQLEEKAETQSRLNTIASTPQSLATVTNKKSNLNSLHPEMTNYQRICVISKYLINKCEEDLNKIKENIKETATTTTTTTILTSNGTTTTKISTRKSRNIENNNNQQSSLKNEGESTSQILNDCSDNRIINKYLENIMKTPSPTFTNTTNTTTTAHTSLQHQDPEYLINLLSTSPPQLKQNLQTTNSNLTKRRESKIDELQQQLSLLLPTTIDNLEVNNSNIQTKQQQQQIISNSLVEFRKFYNNSQNVKLSQNEENTVIQKPTNADIASNVSLIDSTAANNSSSDLLLSSLSMLSGDTPSPTPSQHCLCQRSHRNKKSDDWVLPETLEQDHQTKSSSSSSSSSSTSSKALINLEAETDSNHDTALTLACQGSHDELVKLLIEKGSNIEHRDKKGFTPLILASTAGFTKIVQILIDQHADIEAQSERTKDTALSAAAQSGRYEVVDLLLKNGANKEHRNLSDYTPLSLAASGGYVNIIKLLLENNAEINSRTGSKLGISPLMLAAMNGHTQAVKLLIDMGSDINAQIETNRNTALTLACFQGKADVVNLLLERKANIEHRAKTGLTPLMEAASGGYESVGRVLIDKGADVNAPPVPVSKDTALTIASDKGHTKFVQLLIENGGIIDTRNKKGFTPLWLACSSGHLDVCQILVANGANADIEDLKKVSCLMAAFRKGHIKIVKYIVKHVKQFPSDTDCMKYIASLNEKELVKKCQQCMEIIINAKEKQAQEANKIANSLLKEIDAEKIREKSKKAAAARKREKRKMKKKIQKETSNGDEEKLANADDKEEEEEEVEDEINEIEEIQFIEQTPQQSLNQNKKKQKKQIKQKINETIDKPLKTEPEPLKVTTDKKDESNNQEIKKNKKSSTPIPVVEKEVKQQLKSPQQNQESSLAALDDFEPISQLKHQKKTTKSKSVLNENFENDWKEVTHSNLAKLKRIQIPNDKFTRVVGRGNNNIKVINELTGAILEIEKHQTISSTSTNNNDKFIVIKGSIESVKYATELLMALINNSDSDLVNLLPNNKNISNKNNSTSSVNSSISSTSSSITSGNERQLINNNTKPNPHKQLSSSNNNSYHSYVKLNKNNSTTSSSIMSKTPSSTSVSWATPNPAINLNESSYNPLFSSASLLTASVPSDNKIIDQYGIQDQTEKVPSSISKSNSNATINNIKRNFAEVAKQSLANTTTTNNNDNDNNRVQQIQQQNAYKRNSSISPSLLIPATAALFKSTGAATPIASSDHVKILKSDYSRVNTNNNKSIITQTSLTKIDNGNNFDEYNKQQQQFSIKQKPISIVQPSYSSISQSVKQSNSTPSLTTKDNSFKTDQFIDEQEYQSQLEYKILPSITLPSLSQNYDPLSQQTQKLFNTPVPLNNSANNRNPQKHQPFYQHQQSDIKLSTYLDQQHQLSHISSQRQQYLQSTPSILPIIPAPENTIYSASSLNDYMLNESESSSKLDKKWLNATNSITTPSLTSTPSKSLHSLANEITTSPSDKPIPAPIGHERHGKQHNNSILQNQQKASIPVLSQQNQQFFNPHQFNASHENESYLQPDQVYNANYFQSNLFNTTALTQQQYPNVFPTFNNSNYYNKNQIGNLNEFQELNYMPPHTNLIENNNQLLSRAVVISSSSSPSLSASSNIVNSNLLTAQHENYTWQPNNFNVNYYPATSPLQSQINQHFSFLTENKNPNWISE